MECTLWWCQVPISSIWELERAFFPPDPSCSNGGYHHPSFEQLEPEVYPVSDIFPDVPFSAQSRKNGRLECGCKTNHNNALWFCSHPHFCQIAFKFLVTKFCREHLYINGKKTLVSIWGNHRGKKNYGSPSLTFFKWFHSLAEIWYYLHMHAIISLMALKPLMNNSWHI